MPTGRNVATLLSLLFIATACARSGAESTNAPLTLTLGAYTTPREAYREIIPAFVNDWKEKTGQTITFEESYLGSGAQARAIAGGFEADLAALSLEPDLETLVKAGLVSPDWKTGTLGGGIVTRSIVVIAVRPGNPKNIKTWDDLRRAVDRAQVPHRAAARSRIRREHFDPGATQVVPGFDILGIARAHRDDDDRAGDNPSA